MKQKLKASAYMLVLALVFVVLDRFAKIYMSDTLTLGNSVTVIKNFLSLSLVHNEGIAFGLLKPYNTLLSGIVFVVLMVVLGFSAHEFPRLNIVDKISAAMIIGGGSSNLYDRIAYGHVIDFIDFHVWPVFNFADIFICVGFFVISVQMYRREIDASGIA